jgi:DNA-binding winged helix-turn-helix (wHTH) protein/Tfp pilus assembly protein PilF/TolB-like protein
MESTAISAKIFRFGLFEADAAQGTLTRNGMRVKIQDQPFRVLVLLLERPAEIVSREELRQRLWPEGTFVDFDGSLNVILKKLRAAIDEDSDNPRFIETVPRRGYRFIAPVTAIGAKQETITAPIPALEHPPRVPDAQPSPTVSVPAAHTTSRSRILMYASLGMAALIVVAAFVLWSHYESPKRTAQSEPKAPVPIRKSVAVLGFHNIFGRAEDAWLATAFSEMLSTELAGGEKLRLVSGEDVAHLRQASPWSQTDTLNQETTAHIGAALNSDLLVLGSYTILDKADRGQLRLDVRLQDAKTGEILAEIAEIGSTQDLFDVVSRAGEKLRARIGVPPLGGSDQAGVLAALPVDREAARLYALGIARLRNFDVLAAKDLLQQATKADPKFSLGHAMLARAWSELGYEQNRREEAKKALDLASDLPRAQRMLVEGEYYESLGDQENAASTYRVLFELFPDNLEYGLRLVTALSMAGHSSQAGAVISQLRRLPSPASDDPRIDLLEVNAGLANDPARLVLIRSAEKKAQAQDKPLVYALARKAECLNLNYSDRPSAAPPACEDAYNLFIMLGNRVGAADSIRLMADGIGLQGHYDQAIATYQRALNVLEGMGENQKTGAILNNMAINFENEGRMVRAEQLYRQAMLHFEAAGNKTNQAVALGNIADILYARGNLTGAEKAYRHNLDFIAATDSVEPNYQLYRLADLELTEGRVAQARDDAEQAVAIGRRHQGAYQYLTGAMAVLGEVFEAQGDFESARRQFQDSLEIQQKIGALELIAETQVELANLALDEEHPERAEPLLRSAIAEFEKEKSDPAASNAHTLLSRALLMQGKLDESRKAVQRAIDLSKTSSDPALRLPAEMQAARLQMSGTDPRAIASARQRLRSLIANAKKLGYYNLECEARLILGELDLKSNPSSGRPALAALASEARSHGMEFLAHQAEQAAEADAAVASNKSAH